MRNTPRNPPLLHLQEEAGRPRLQAPANTNHPSASRPHVKKGKAVTMRVALCKDYGNVDEMLSVVEDAPRPVFDPAAKASRGRALIRVKATALAPGDVRVLSGRTREIQGPPSVPYVAGGADLCG